MVSDEMPVRNNLIYKGMILLMAEGSTKVMEGDGYRVDGGDS